MTTPLQKAARALIERWDSPAWKDQPHTAEYIAELRKALDAEIALAVEPVAVFNGLVDSGEHGAFNLDMLKMIPRGAPLYLHPPQQATTPMSDFNVRGVLASNLLCWKRLTEAEAQDLVCFFEKVRTAQGEKPQATTPAANWLIRKEPNTKDKYFVAEGNPPEHVLEIYGIAGEKL